MPSVFSEDLISSDKSRLFAPLWPKFSLSAAVAAALILEVVVAARSEKKTFYREILRSRDPDIFLKKKPHGGSFMWGSNKISGLRLRVRAAVGEIMLNKVPWALGEVSL